MTGRSESAGSLDEVLSAVARYQRAQERRAAAYTALLAAIRTASVDSGVSLRVLARVCGFSITRVRQIVHGRVNRRDGGIAQ